MRSLNILRMSASAATFAQATAITDDIVLNQQDMMYDDDGNLVETINKDRFNTDATSGSGVYGALGDKSGTGGPAARVSYVFDYYDAADRATEQDDYGTNQGTAITGIPAKAGVSSSDVLVSKYGYDAAGNQNVVTDPKGIVSKSVFNLAGQATSTIADYTGSSPSINSDQTTDYTYEGSAARGQRTQAPQGGSADVR